MDSLTFYDTLKSCKEGQLYLDLINRVKSENRGPKLRNDGFEVHHIFPYTWSNDSSEANSVKLSIPEHITAHYYLARIFGGVMYYAFHILTGRTVKHLDGVTLSELERNLPHWSETRRKASHRKHSEAEHEAMRKAQKEIHSREDYIEAFKIRMSKLHRGKIPWNKGKTMPEEVRHNMSKAMKGKKHRISDEHRKKIGEFNRKKAQDPVYRKKLSDAKKGRKKIYRDVDQRKPEIKYVPELDLKNYTNGWYIKVFDQNSKTYQKEYLS